MDTPTPEHDMTGIRCPMPIVRLNRIIADAATDQEFIITADDPAFAPDVKAWCRRTGHELVDLVQVDGMTKAHLRKSA